MYMYMCPSELLLGSFHAWVCDCVYMCLSELLLELPHAQGLCVYICDRARINQPYAAIYNLRVRAYIGGSGPSWP